MCWCRKTARASGQSRQTSRQTWSREAPVQLDLHALYGLTGMLIIVCWGLLILHPDRSSRWITVPKFAVPTLFGLIYAGIMMAKFFDSGGGYGSIAAVRALFAHDDILLAGWLHYLAYDFFIGVLIAYHAERIGLLIQIQVAIMNVSLTV